MSTNAIRVQQAALEARSWMSAGRLLLALCVVPSVALLVSGMLLLSSVGSSPSPWAWAGWLPAGLAALVLFGAAQLAFRALRRAAGGPLVGALTWLSSAGILASLLYLSLAASFGWQAAEGLARALVPSLLAWPVLPFVAAWPALVGVTRPGSPERARLARLYGAAAALVASPILLAVGSFTAARAGGGSLGDTLALCAVLAALCSPLLLLPLGFVAERLRLAMERLLPDPPAEALALARRLASPVLRIEREEEVSPGVFWLEGWVGDVPAAVQLDLALAPARLVVSCEIPGLPLGLQASARAGGPAGVSLGDPVLDSALRVEGAGSAAASALFAGLHADLLEVLAQNPGAQIADQRLIVPVPYAAEDDPPLAGSLRAAARLASLLAARGGAPQHAAGSALPRRQPLEGGREGG